MDQEAVQARALEFGDALVTGAIDRAIDLLSDELKRNPGEVVALLPLPATEVSIASLERGSSSYVAVLHVTSETAEDELQTRWKDRDGEPRIVEVSHLSRTEREQPLEDEFGLEGGATPDRDGYEGALPETPAHS